MKINGPVQLSRMLIEEAGPDPSYQARALLDQLPCLKAPVPVHAIAEALDIVHIEEAPTRSLEAALVTDATRSAGVIVVNSASSWRRRRYSVGHELGQFLNPAHRPVGQDPRFACTTKDLAQAWPAGRAHRSRHVRQEAEANRFAIELLAPEQLVRPLLADIPDLAVVNAMSDRLHLSREACARRYVELSPHPMAVVFSKDGVVRYSQKGRHFPFAVPRSGKALELADHPAAEIGIDDRVVVDARVWLGRSLSCRLTAQTLWQQGGYTMTLLEIHP